MFSLLTSWENLLLAYHRASKGKRGNPAVAAFEYRLEDNLLELQARLRHHTYEPGAYTHFFIHEPKRRLISAAPFRDRVVHHALCNLIEPIFERTFIATLRLTMHPGSHPYPVSEGIPFLGFVVFPHRRRLKRRKGIHFQRHLRALFTAFYAGKLPAAQVTIRVKSWVNHVRYGNTVGLRQAVLGYRREP